MATGTETHQHALRDGETAVREARVNPRFSFRTVQRFAPVVHGRLPSISTFRSVWCNDISLGGISFFWSCVPEFQKIIIELQAETGPLYMRAQILGSVLDLYRSTYLIRCQFAGRVESLPE